MEVLDEKIQVIRRDAVEPEHGARPEPEELPAKSILEVKAPLAGPNGIAEKGIRTFVTAELDVETAAKMSGARCQHCRFWNQARWRDTFRRLDRSPDIAERREANGMRGLFRDGAMTADVREMHAGPDKDFDTEAAVGSLGVCEAFTDIYHPIYVAQSGPGEHLVTTHPLAGCPQAGPDGQPAPFLFYPRDRDARAAGAGLYDRVLRLADGRVPKLYFGGKK